MTRWPARIVIQAPGQPPPVQPRATDMVVTRWGLRWRGRVYPCAVGRGGIGPKRHEGDGITPQGVFRVVELRHRADRLRLPGSRPLRLADAWCEDPQSPAYNLPIRWSGRGDRLWRADPLYDIVAVLDYNRAPVRPGAGSAIFLHLWRRPRHPTAGCIAVSAPTLRQWLKRTV